MYDALDIARAPRRRSRRSPFAMARRRVRRPFGQEALDDWEEARRGARRAA